MRAWDLWRSTLTRIWPAVRWLVKHRLRKWAIAPVMSMFQGSVMVFAVKRCFRRLVHSATRLQRGYRKVLFRNRLRLCIFAKLFVDAEEAMLSEAGQTPAHAREPAEPVPDGIRFRVIMQWLRKEFRNHEHARILARKTFAMPHENLELAEEKTPPPARALTSVILSDLQEKEKNEPSETVEIRFCTIQDSTFKFLVLEARKQMRRGSKSSERLVAEEAGSGTDSIGDNTGTRQRFGTADSLDQKLSRESSTKGSGEGR